MSRYVTDEPVGVRIEERFALYRLCPCAACGGRGKVPVTPELQHLTPEGSMFGTERCAACRGEGRTRELVCTTETPEGIGTALYTLALEGEWDECPIGVLDRMPELQDEQPGKKWLVKPWLPSARNISDAGRTLRSARRERA